jgi:hypothetical protein
MMYRLVFSDAAMAGIPRTSSLAILAGWLKLPVPPPLLPYSKRAVNNNKIVFFCYIDILLGQKYASNSLDYTGSADVEMIM